MNQIFRAMILMVVILALFGVSETSGFMVRPPPSTKRSLVQQRTQQRGILLQDGSSRSVYHSAVIDSSSIMVSAETWRQYVPLTVSVGIIIDILLGSPFANKILAPMRPEGEGDEGKKDKKNDGKPKSKARIDAELIAKRAVDKANNTLELRNFLEERKTDYDRMEEMKRKLDATMQDLDEDMEARQKAIDERKT
jgi:hypothetical protein